MRLNLISTLFLAFVSSLLANNAQADLTFDLTQEGNDVVMTGSGSVDLTGLNFFYTTTGTQAGVLRANPALLEVGANAYNDVYQPASGVMLEGPTTFGTGAASQADFNTGDLFGLNVYGSVFVPEGYISGASLSGTSTWNNASLSSLGVTPGTYTFSWEGGNTTITLVTSVPEPSTYALLGTGVMVLLCVYRFRRDKSVR